MSLVAFIISDILFLTQFSSLAAFAEQMKIPGMIFENPRCCVAREYGIINHLNRSNVKKFRFFVTKY